MESGKRNETLHNQTKYSLFPSNLSERTEHRYLLEKKIHSVYPEYLACVSLLSQSDQLMGRKEPADSVYRSRTSSSTRFITRHFSGDAMGGLEEDSNRFELSELEKGLIQVFHMLRSLSIDLRLYVAIGILFHL